MPKMLQHDLAFPIVTIGSNNTGSSMHQHEESWLLLLQGRKAWWIRDNPGRTFARRNPCQHLGEDVPAGWHFCIQNAGELVYFPNDAYHATCNMDHLVTGIGSQGSNADWPPLVMAASLGHSRSVKKAMRSKKIDRATFAAALQRALGLGHQEVAETLVEHAGYMSQNPGDSVGYMTSSPLHAVAESGAVRLARRLLSKNVEAEEAYSREVSFISLEISAYLGHLSLVELLAQLPGPLMQSQPQTLLANALRNSAQNGHLPVMRLLANLGANPMSPDGQGRLALHMAAAGGQVGAMKVLLEMHGASLSYRDQNGHTPLHAAAERGHAKVLRFLLKKSADWDPRVLHLAARQGHSPVLRLLLARLASGALEAKTEAGGTLHLAVTSGSLNATELLLEHRAQLDAADHGGNQALHVAAHHGDLAMVRLLLKWRADVAAQGAGGQAWVVAQEQQHDSLARMLRQSSHEL
ncbi:unnamed protein product [Effrenium voratum]|nr:unnamed protein product [Effrenium voratum]